MRVRNRAGNGSRAGRARQWGLGAMHSHRGAVGERGEWSASGISRFVPGYDLDPSILGAFEGVALPLSYLLPGPRRLSGLLWIVPVPGAPSCWNFVFVGESYCAASSMRMRYSSPCLNAPHALGFVM
jgi:hypothetical protein